MNRPNLNTLTKIFDFVASKQPIYEAMTVYTALIAFLIHLFLIFIKNKAVFPTGTLSYIDPGYLSAIYTPFSIILFYEVFSLILSVPKSMVSSIGKQFQIVALITLWGVLKNFAQLENIDSLITKKMVVLKSIGVDMLGSIGMFMVIAIFYVIARSIPKDKTKKHIDFISKEKALSLVLIIIFICLSIYDITQFVVGNNIDLARMPLGNHIFYQNIYTVMIFVDVICLIFSFLYTSDFGIVFLNGGFVISAILIRFSLSIDKEFSIFFSLGSMLFSLIALAIYRYVWLKTIMPITEETIL
jgi:hypothetical protein